MLHRAAQHVSFEGGEVVLCIAKSDAPQVSRRAAIAIIGDAAIKEAFVVEIFIRQIDRGLAAQFCAEGWVDADLFAIIKIAVIVQAFVRCIDPQRRICARGKVQVGPQVIGAKGVDGPAVSGEGFAHHALLGHAVENAASAAAPEQQRVGAAQNFDLFEVVEPAVIFNVIAHAVDKEIGG